MKLNALVTGIGGDIGQSIGKIILDSPGLFHPPVGTDLHDKHAGIFIFKNHHSISSIHSESYFEQIQGLIEKYSIDVIIPTSEAELRVYQTQMHSSDFPIQIPVLTANQTSMEIGFDKLSTIHFLAQHNLPYPETCLLKEMGVFDHKIIIKNRASAGSKDIFVIANQTDLDFYRQKYPDFIAQMYLDSSDEYTCGVFRNAKGKSACIIYKRRLSGGYSVYGEIIHDDSIEALCLSIAEKLKLQGSINIQLKLIEGIPYVFEINPRFSSTVLFRHLMGFKDFIWSVEDLLELSTDFDFIIPEKGEFFRGTTEFIK
jgi:carbamoyl-phosphate synthase large subunit